MATIVIGTRSSKLALWQTDYVAERLRELFPALTVEKKIIKTKGDKILDVPLAKIGGKGLFTKELEEAMLTGQIDAAVHSLKDMPTVLPQELTIAAITKREYPWDALVGRNNMTLEALPPAAVVGTSSLRRKAQLLHLRPDLKIVNLRGNVNTRLQKLAAGEFDAIVLAAAGLYRLGQASAITEILSPEIMVPAVGQGALAIETRRDNPWLSELSRLQDEPTALAVSLERSFLRCVEGGCQVPVGVYATLNDNLLTAQAIIASINGQEFLRRQITGSSQDAVKLGESLAQEMLNAGGQKILRALL